MEIIFLLFIRFDYMNIHHLIIWI